MHTSPDIQAFIDLVDRRFVRDRLESFWDIEPAFRELVCGALPRQAINAELQRVVANPSYMGDWRPNQFLLHRGQGFALSIRLLESSRRYIHSMPFFGLLAPIGDQRLNYTRYDLPLGYRNDVFDPALRIHTPSAGQVEGGDALKMQSDRHIYDFHIDAPIVVVKLTTAPFQSMEWLFNKETGYAWQANDGEIKATQLRVAAYILGKLADPSSVEPLKQLSEHAHHAVRWAAVQSLGRISRSAAVAKLEQSLTDPHPHIRRAAARTLAQLKPG